MDLQELDEHGNLVDLPGMVDAYRWMTFYLGESTAATDVLFKSVIDAKWLAESTDPSAALLRTLKVSRQSLKSTLHGMKA